MFLEKDLRGVDGVLENSHAYLNWVFENNGNVLKDEYLMTQVEGMEQIKAELLRVATDKLEKLMGNQRWRQLFLTGQEMANFLRQIGYGFNYFSQVKDYFELDYWIGCSRHIIFDKNFEGKLAALLPFDTQDIIKNSDYRYGGGGEIMMDAMPEFAEAMDDGAMEEKMEEDAPMAGDSATDTSATSSNANESEPETGNASTEANNEIELESKMIKENTVFFTMLGWSSEGKVTFTLPEDVSKFRVSVLAISKDGRYGTHTDFVSSQKKFDVHIDYPLYLYASETVDLEVSLYNNDSENITVTNDFSSDSWFVDANSLKRVTFTVPVSELPKTFAFESSNSESNSVLVNPLVKHGLNFKHSRTYMIREAEQSTQALPPPIKLPSDKVPGSVKMQMTYTPFGAPVILTGYETLIREPFGCFEQTSATVFPMVMLFKYLEKLDSSQRPEKYEEMLFNIKTNLKKGATKLLSFETETGGFEWFGQSPGHPTLTAYGLWLFKELNEVGKYIGPDVIDRTLNWLKNQYSSSDIEFALRQGLDSLGNPIQEFSDVFITQVMSEFDDYDIDYSSIIDPIIDKYESSSRTSDSYLMALVGLIFENQKKKDKANSIAAKLIQNQDAETGEFKLAESTITRSRGMPKSVETTALAVLFLIRNDSGNFMEQIEKAINFLSKNANFGNYFSTQGTVLSLKANIKFSEYVAASKAGKKNFEVQIEDVTKTYEVDISENPNAEYDPLVFDEFKDTQLTSINVNIIPKFTLEKNSKYVFSLDYEYGTRSPLSVDNSPLKVEMTSNTLSDAESFSLKVTNLTSEILGMVNLIFYKPSNLKVNLNDLESLRKMDKVDYYELLKQNSEIVFYWRGIGANSSYQVDLTLSKEYEVSQRFPAKVGAYLYYDKDGSLVFA